MKQLSVPLRGPLDVAASMETFRRFGSDLIDIWDGTHLVRTVPTPSGPAAYAAAVHGSLERPVLEVSLDRSAPLNDVAEAVRDSFLSTPPDYAGLLERDPVLASLDEKFPGLRPVLQPDLLTALIRSVSAQQVNLAWAATTRRRLAEAFGVRQEVAGYAVYRFEPERLAGATVEEIRAMQFTTRKAEYIVGMAQAIAAGELSREMLEPLPDAEAISRLTALRGIGRWTAEWILARTLGRPVVVAGDLGVRKAVGLAYLDDPLPLEDAVRRATEHWGASAGVAQALLLQGLVTQELPGAG